LCLSHYRGDHCRSPYPQHRCQSHHYSPVREGQRDAAAPPAARPAQTANSQYVAVQPARSAPAQPAFAVAVPPSAVPQWQSWPLWLRAVPAVHVASLAPAALQSSLRLAVLAWLVWSPFVPRSSLQAEALGELAPLFPLPALGPA